MRYYSSAVLARLYILHITNMAQQPLYIFVGNIVAP
jgi:hypothetical protein